MALFPGTPKLESRNCPETVPGGVPELWALITPDGQVWSRWGLNQTCSPRRDLSNDVSHFPFGGWEEVDSRLLVVGSQTASLTPIPSFAHNLNCKCANGQCEAIFNIYASRPFQWHQKHPNARCFGPFCRTLNIQESRRTPNPQLWKCWASPPHLAKVGLQQTPKVGAHLGEWGFIPSHSLALPRAWNVTLGLHIWPAPLRALALVTSPRLRLRHQCTESKPIAEVKMVR